MNELARQMQHDPSPLDNPAIQQYMEMRQRINQADSMRERIAPGPERGGTMAAVEGLGRILGGGTSLALTGDTNPMDALHNLLGSMRGAKENAMTGRGDPLTTGMAMMPMRGALSERGRALHGEEVRSQLLAKRAAKGPRKPGSGKRPTAAQSAQTKAKPEADLKTALGKSVSQPKKKSFLERFKRNKKNER